MLPIVVIGGGAAGFFAAISAASKNRDRKIILLEKSKVLLSKVRISGGGRCNVTHACFEPALLIKNYPRGSKALLGPFHKFQPRDTIQWFESRGVPLKVEEDGRIFPLSDSSQSIIECLIDEAKKQNVEIYFLQKVDEVEVTDFGFRVAGIDCSALLLATGSSKEGYEIAKSLGHTIVPLVPSLFTFNVPDFILNKLSGVSVERVKVELEGTNFSQEGPLLITHFGFSGPCVLKLSAFAARYLNEKEYDVKLIVNWLPQFSRQELYTKLIESNPLLPKSLFHHFLEQRKIKELSKKQLNILADRLQRDVYLIKGKTTNKQEFVTAGGIALDEVDFKTMQSKLCRGLYFAGEILDIDGITGGFNFQNAWTTGWIAGQSIG